MKFHHGIVTLWKLPAMKGARADGSMNSFFTFFLKDKVIDHLISTIMLWKIARNSRNSVSHQKMHYACGGVTQPLQQKVWFVLFNDQGD